MRGLDASWKMLIGLGAGLACGTAVSLLNRPSLSAASESVGIVGTVWVNALLMSVVPLVFSSLVVSVAALGDAPRIGTLLGRTLGLFIAMLATVAGLTALIAPHLFAWLPAEPALFHTVAAGGAPSSSPPEPFTLARWFTELVPANPIRAAADGAMLPLLVFALALGIAISQIGGDARDVLIGLFQAIVLAMHRILRWTLSVAPIGVGALALNLAAHAGSRATWALGYYAAVSCGLCLALTLLLYPLVVLAGRVPLWQFAAACLPAQMVAFGCHSSLASLPTMLESAERHLEAPATLTHFVLPFAASCFKFSAPILFLVAVTFVAQLTGTTLDGGQLASVGLVAITTSFGVPGIPNGGPLVMAPVFVASGLPVEAVGVLMAVEVLPGALRTVSNVTADLTVVTLLRTTACESATPQSSSPWAGDTRMLPVTLTVPEPK